MGVWNVGATDGLSKPTWQTWSKGECWLTRTSATSATRKLKRRTTFSPLVVFPCCSSRISVDGGMCPQAITSAANLINLGETMRLKNRKLEGFLSAVFALIWGIWKARIPLLSRMVALLQKTFLVSLKVPPSVGLIPGGSGARRCCGQTGWVLPSRKSRCNL